MESQHSSTPSLSPDDSSRDIVEGERYGQLIRLKPEYKERYLALHAHPFPGLIEQLRDANLHNYSIFLRDGVLFSFYEYSGDDYEEDMEAVASNPTVQDWWTLTDPMQKSLSQEDPDEWWVVMEEVFHGGSKVVPSREASKNAFVQLLSDSRGDALHRIFSGTESELRTALEEAGLQNYGVYRWEDHLYTYFECVSGSVDTSLARLHDDSAFRHVQRKLDSLSPDVSSSCGEGRTAPGESRPMESVFYME